MGGKKGSILGTMKNIVGKEGVINTAYLISK